MSKGFKRSTFFMAIAAFLAGCGGSDSGGNNIGAILSPCLATELAAANGAFIACDPIVLDGGPALTFDLEGRQITYDGNGNRVEVSAWTMYSETDCAGQVGIYDFQGVGIENNYGISVDGDIYLSDGATPINWTRMSKVLNASGTFVCSNNSLGDPGPFFEAELVMDVSDYPTPYSIVPIS